MAVKKFELQIFFFVGSIPITISLNISIKSLYILSSIKENDVEKFELLTFFETLFIIITSLYRSIQSLYILICIKTLIRPLI